MTGTASLGGVSEEMLANASASSMCSTGVWAFCQPRAQAGGQKAER